MIEADERRVYSGGRVAFWVGMEREEPLGTRHDPTAHRDWASINRADFANRPDRGNVAFYDGHVDYVPRQYTWSRKNWYPFGKLFANTIEPE